MRGVKCIPVHTITYEKHVLFSPTTWRLTSLSQPTYLSNKRYLQPSLTIYIHKTAYFIRKYFQLFILRTLTFNFNHRSETESRKKSQVFITSVLFQMHWRFQI